MSGGHNQRVPKYDLWPCVKTRNPFNNMAGSRVSSGNVLKCTGNWYRLSRIEYPCQASHNFPGEREKDGWQEGISTFPQAQPPRVSRSPQRLAFCFGFSWANAA